MKSELAKKWKSFLQFCRENKKITLLALMAVLLITGLQTASFLSRSGSYVTDQKGRVKAIIREDSREAASFSLRIKAKKDSSETEQDLILSLGGQSGKNTDTKETTDPVEELNDQIENMTREIESSSENKIPLPDHLDDGTSILWYKDRVRPSFAALLLFPLVMFMFYRDSLQKQRNLEKKKLEDVRRSLPGFNNQLLLLLGSGLIFYDAFVRIAEGYARRPGGRNYFTEMVTEIMKQSEAAGSSLVMVLDSHAKKLSVKEFSRIINIISDNQYKGVNLTEKLESESDILWTQRKKTAEEKGRIAETKLTFPLALLLLVLIMVTAAPAIMEM